MNSDPPAIFVLFLSTSLNIYQNKIMGSIKSLHEFTLLKFINLSFIIVIVMESCLFKKIHFYKNDRKMREKILNKIKIFQLNLWHFIFFFTDQVQYFLFSLSNSPLNRIYTFFKKMYIHRSLYSKIYIHRAISIVKCPLKAFLDSSWRCKNEEKKSSKERRNIFFMSFYGKRGVYWSTKSSEKNKFYI